ncbi:MAG: hypothetical protein LBJ00_05600 [Planctomycetaceae bacterium]|nr:hypothetical protein [Planctomycetaceae bacterium]
MFVPLISLNSRYFLYYTQAILKFTKLNTQARHREAVVHGRSLPPYWLRYTHSGTSKNQL